MPKYEVVIQRATTYHVEAVDEQDAITRALKDEGVEVDWNTWDVECTGEIKETIE